MYVAIPGSTNPPTDGNAYIHDAIARGAKTIITDAPDFIALDDITIIGVPDARIALSRVSNAFYDNPSHQLRIFGITGTNGKTSTSFLLKAIFDALGEPTGLIGTTGNYIGDERIAATHTTPESPHLC
ncbi:MAG: Mur ligase family protein, partial [Bacteroidota bacterium]